MSNEDSLEYDSKAALYAAIHNVGEPMIEEPEERTILTPHGIKESLDWWVNKKKEYDPNVFLISKLQNDMENVKVAKSELLVAVEELSESFNNWLEANKGRK